MTPTDIVIAALERGGFGPGIPEGQNLRFRCPAHNGTRQNLSVCEGDNGNVVVICHSHSCKYNSIMHALGLRPQDGFPQTELQAPRHLSAKKVLHENGNGRHAGNGSALKTPAELLAIATRYADAITDAQRQQLADALGLPVASTDAIELLGSGIDPRHGFFWAYPEVNGSSQICGVTKRFAQAFDEKGNNKKCEPGSRRGLFAPKSWARREGPLLICEGMSDALAATAAGLPAIARMNKTQKTETIATTLAEFVKGKAAERPVVVIADADDSGPESKAKLLAEALTKQINNPVEWAPAPDDAKDLRKWLCDRPGNETWADRGQKLLKAIQPERQERKKAYNPRIYRSSEFFLTEFRREFLVRGVLVKQQPAVIGGAKKMLKSGIGIDLAVSLDTATPFLGYERFAVRERVNVLVINGESGEATLKETARRIAHARRLSEHDLQILWSADLPQLANAEHLSDLADILRKDKIGVVMVDPTYLCLFSGLGPGGPQASNLFDMGAIYMHFARRCLEVGATPILFSHCKKGRGHEPADLDDLAFAGIAEFARQWILLSRREDYRGDGIHKLWINAGGSAGHSFLGHIDIDEGILADDFTGRKWEVDVTPAGVATENQKHQRDELKAEQYATDELAIMALIDRLANAGDIATKTRIRGCSGISRTRTDDALERLRQQRLIVEYQGLLPSGNGAKKSATAFKRTEDK